MSDVQKLALADMEEGSPWVPSILRDGVHGGGRKVKACLLRTDVHGGGVGTGMSPLSLHECFLPADKQVGNGSKCQGVQGEDDKCQRFQRVAGLDGS